MLTGPRPAVDSSNLPRCHRRQRNQIRRTTKTLVKQQFLIHSSALNRTPSLTVETTTLVHAFILSRVDNSALHRRHLQDDRPRRSIRPVSCHSTDNTHFSSQVDQEGRPDQFPVTAPITHTLVHK